MSETGAAAMADETADDENPEGQERKMSSTPVQRDQFEVSLKGITHKPTGATYIPHPGAPYSGNMKSWAAWKRAAEWRRLSPP